MLLLLAMLLSSAMPLLLLCRTLLTPGVPGIMLLQLLALH
jgi:hypothetical protein